VVFVIPDKLKIELTNLPSPCVQSYTFGSIYPARPGLIFPQVFAFVPLYLLTTMLNGKFDSRTCHIIRLPLIVVR